MQEVQNTLSLFKELEQLRPLNAEQEARIMQKFRLDWNYHSNHLEGNSLTYGETKALILFGITAQGKPLKDHFEITGHDEAIKWITDVVKSDRPLTENFIRELHQLILKEPYEKKALTADGQSTKRTIQVGQYKQVPNHVLTSTGEMFYFATPEETPARMNDLMDWYNDEIQKNDVNPIFVAALFHYKFIRIHPFDDGNGRTARILMNFILMRFGYPPVIIKTEDKSNYFAVLRLADADQFEPFIEYIAQNLNRSLEIMIAGAKGEEIEEDGDIDKEIALLDQKIKGFKKKIKITKSKDVILDVFDNQIVKTADAFKEKMSKFNHLYIETEFYIYSNYEFENAKNNISEYRNIIDGNEKTISLFYRFKEFKNSEIKDVLFASRIDFIFETYEYYFRDYLSDSKLPIKYGDYILQNIIESEINSEIKHHLKFIEQKIEEAQKANE